MKTIKAMALLIGMVCAVAWPVAGQEVVTDNNLIAGARALGMGGAQIGMPGGLNAIWGNPAALARIENIETQLGVIWANRRIESNLAGTGVNGSGDTDDSALSLGTFGLAYPVPTRQGSFVLALGYNRVKDFTGTFGLSGYDSEAFVDGADVWGGYYDNEIIEDGGLNVLSFAGAVDVAPNVSLGMSFDIWTGSYSIDKRVVRNDYEGQVSWLDMIGGDDDITAWSLKPSILYFDRLIRAGAYLRLPMTYHIKQDNYEELYSTNDGYFFGIHERIDSYIEDNYTDSYDYWTADYKIKAPMELGLGMSIGEPGRTCAAFDMVFENWSDAEFDDDDDPYYFRDQYRDTLSWRVGIEQKLPGLPTVARVGYMHDPAKFKGPRESGGPIIKTTDERDYFTVGLTAQLDPNFQLDIAYAQGFWRSKEGARVDDETLSRLYTTITYRLPPVGSLRNW